MDKNCIEGTKHEIKAAAKEAAGKGLGSRAKAKTGKLEKAMGKIQKEMGKAGDGDRKKK